MENIPTDELVDFGVRLLTRKGVPEDDARYVAETVVRTEACGITTHGVVLFEYFDKQVGESIVPEAQPFVAREKGATASIDGNRSFGQLAMRLAKQTAVRKARDCGIAMVGTVNTFWLGALGIHLASLAEEGFLAQLWGQTTGYGTCAPFGGIDGGLGTNPVALAFPAPEGPAIADFSTSAISRRKVDIMLEAGQKAPEPLFMDGDGNATCDPQAVLRGGTILFMGGERYGYRGYALSLWSEALAALAGAECSDPRAKPRHSFNLTVIDPEAFAGGVYYRKEMQAFVARLKAARLRPGSTEVRLPGERALGELRRSEREGIPLDEAAMKRLNAVAKGNGIAPIDAASS